MNKSAIFVINENGNIFKDRSSAFVCPVNICGAMGKGLALEFKRKFPDMFFEYKQACNNKLLKIGQTFLFVNNYGESPNYIICFPTKIHWRESSKLRYIRSGLKSLKWTIINCKIHSIAIPALGCGLGGLDFDEVLETIQNELYNLQDIRITIYAPKENGSWGKKNC